MTESPGTTELPLLAGLSVFRVPGNSADRLLSERLAQCILSRDSDVAIARAAVVVAMAAAFHAVYRRLSVAFISRVLIHVLPFLFHVQRYDDTVILASEMSIKND